MDNGQLILSCGYIAPYATKIDVLCVVTHSSLHLDQKFFAICTAVSLLLLHNQSENFFIPFHIESLCCTYQQLLFASSVPCQLVHGASEYEHPHKPCSSLIITIWLLSKLQSTHKTELLGLITCFCGPVNNVLICYKTNGEERRFDPRQNAQILHTDPIFITALKQIQLNRIDPCTYMWV